MTGVPDWIRKDILIKYDSGRVIDPEDRIFIERYADLGLMHLGYSPRYQKLTAKTNSICHSKIT